MDPAVLLLESLQRDVLNGSLNVIGATQKLKGIIHEVAKDDSRQFFRQIFPKLLHFIIGHCSSVYKWLLLVPFLLCRGLLELCADSRAAAEVRSLLDPHGDLFSAIIYLQASDPTTRFEVPVSDLVDDASLAGRSAKLDYCDFFYFHLVKIVTALPINKAEQEKSRPQHGFAQAYRKFMSLGLGVPFHEKSCRWNHDLVADTYLSVLKAHLEFVLPINVGREANVFTSPMLRSKMNVAAKLGDSLSGLINQLWFEQPTKNRRLPTLDVVHAAEVAVKHICAAVCQNSGNNRFMTQSIEGAFSGLRTSLYKFLCVNIASWPLDNNFVALIQVWKAFAAPWTHLNLSEEASFWNPFVLNNFCFYVVPLNSILEHIEGAVEALVSLQVKTKLILQGEDFVRRLAPSIDCLVVTTEVLNPISGLIKSVESSEYSGRRPTHYSEFKILDQFAALEPELRTLPAVFDGAGTDRAMNLIRWLEKAHLCLQKMGLASGELALDGKVLKCQDDLAHAFDINDVYYAKFLEQKEAEEAADKESILTPRRRNLIPATPDSKMASLKGIRALTPSFKNDEIPILLTLFTFLTEKLNKLVRLGLMQVNQRFPVPQWVFHLAQVDLRFLAVWQNLVFSVVTLTFMYILLKTVF